MKHRVTLMVLIAFFVSIVCIADKPKVNGRIDLKELNAAEKEDVADSMANMQADKAWVERIENSRSFKGTNVRCAPQMRALRAWQDTIDAGQVNCKVRVDGEYEIRAATMTDVEKYTRLDRWYNADPNTMEAILMKRGCPLDGHLYADDFGVAE